MVIPFVSQNEMWEYLMGPAGVDVEGNEADHLIYHADDNKVCFCVA